MTVSDGQPGTHGELQERCHHHDANVGAPELDKELGRWLPAAIRRADPDGTRLRAYADQVMEEMRRTFRPEFLNRLDDMIVFRPLTSDQIRSIVGILVERVRGELRGQDMGLD